MGARPPEVATLQTVAHRCRRRAGRRTVVGEGVIIGLDALGERRGGVRRMHRVPSQVDVQLLRNGAPRNVRDGQVGIGVCVVVQRCPHLRAGRGVVVPHVVVALPRAGRATVRRRPLAMPLRSIFFFQEEAVLRADKNSWPRLPYRAGVRRRVLLADRKTTVLRDVAALLQPVV